MNITYITNNKALFPYEDEEEKYTIRYDGISIEKG